MYLVIRTLGCSVSEIVLYIIFEENPNYADKLEKIFIKIQDAINEAFMSIISLLSWINNWVVVNPYIVLGLIYIIV